VYECIKLNSFQMTILAQASLCFKIEKLQS